MLFSEVVVYLVPKCCTHGGSKNGSDAHPDGSWEKGGGGCKFGVKFGSLGGESRTVPEKVVEGLSGVVAEVAS